MTIDSKKIRVCLTSAFVKKNTILDFPFVNEPCIYEPEKTVLKLDERTNFYILFWCYLRRSLKRGVGFYDASSLSVARVQVLPMALQRLSQWFRFNNHRPRTIHHFLYCMGLFLSWVDQPEQLGRYELVLADPELALMALKNFHTYLRNQIQSHQLAPSTAATREQYIIACLSEIHSCNYRNYIEPLKSIQGKGTEAPDDETVGVFSSVLQAIFDSASEILISKRTFPSEVLLRVSAMDDSKVIKLRRGYGPLRLMELACVAYVGLVFVDSGANLAVLKDFEKSEDLEDQLAKPDRINLKQKVVKFRAGGKEVEVYLSATTMTRLNTYLRVRQALISALEVDDIAPLFVHCTYDTSRGEPTGICNLSKYFLNFLRRKVKRSGANLPKVTLRQLRTYKQQDLVSNTTVEVAARIMGHSVETAIKAYCKSQESARKGEMHEFLGALQKVVLSRTAGGSGRMLQQVTPVGNCASYENPSPTAQSSIVEPNCNKVEGCFFCHNYRLHADEEDISKLMSCRLVIQRIMPLSSDSVKAEHVYAAVVGRIDVLLAELKIRKPKIYEVTRKEVEVNGQLTRYWAGKIQQLHLLGMLQDTTGK